jgi:hypothetical protein
MKMEILALITSCVGFAASIGVALLCFRKLHNQRGLLEFTEGQIQDLQDTLSKSRELVETNSQRTAEQSRRVAWLETRVRQPRAANEEILEESILTETPKLTITERRHRVIKLAMRGQSVDAIASALGMLKGEVELIVNLSHAAPGNLL